MTETLTNLVRPTLEEVARRLTQNINAKVPGGDAALPQGVLPGLRSGLAAAEHSLYGAIDVATAQSTALLATGSNLDLQGALWGVFRKAATRATGTIRFTGTDGTAIPSGATLRRADGQQYQTSAAGIIASGILDLTVQAVAPGIASNGETGITLALTSPIAGADADGLAQTPLTGGTEAEADGPLKSTDTAFYRGRILFRIQNPPGAGKPSDYEGWALEVPGVTRAFITPGGAGPQTVVILFMMDQTYANGIPVGTDAFNYITGAGDQLTVFEYIAGTEAKDPERRAPVWAKAFVGAPIPAPLTVTISDLDPTTPEIQEAIRVSIADMLSRRAEPGGVIWRSWISEAISVAAGENRHTLAAPTANVTHAADTIPVFDASVITFV